MLKFEIRRPQAEVPSLYIRCLYCNKTNVRGITNSTSLTPFACWSCNQPIPSVLSLLKDKFSRIAYHRHGVITPLTRRY